MNDTHDKPHRLATLLAWYREMGVTAALDEEPIDWRARGDTAPGAGFVMPHREHAPPQHDLPRTPQTQRVDHNQSSAFAAQRVTAPAASAAPPTRRAALPTDDRSVAQPQANVRSFATTATTAPAARIAVTANSLTELAAVLASFEGCGLKATAKNLCLYRGAERARVMLIGEAPGRDEDLAGIPFAGQSGQLLDRMLTAIALNPADVHLTNVVYWRPPGNRAPTAQEVLACAPFLARQMELVAPDVILLLGGASAKAMLATDDSIMKIRGKWREIESGGRKIKTMATLHPGQVLRTPSYKRKVWQDLLAFKTAL